MLGNQFLLFLLVTSLTPSSAVGFPASDILGDTTLNPRDTQVEPHLKSRWRWPFPPKDCDDMDTSKLKPLDSRVEHHWARIRGKTYRYTLGKPHGKPVATMVLIHGFPDLGFGWRNQVPYFMSLGYEVVVPDMLGYAGTDAPEDLSEYSLKSLSADIKELATKFVGEGQIVLGGHDWGGFLVWRIALWYPELIKGVFSVCTPYSAPAKEYYPLEDVIASGQLPNFAYQLQLKGPEVQEKIQGPEKVHQFLNGMYGGVGPDGEVGFEATKGVLFDNLSKLAANRLLSTDEMKYYVQEYMLRRAPQLRGPLNWYRTREINFKEEKPLAEKGVKVEMPALFITATNDSALPPSMSVGMEKHFNDLTRGEVKASHWALWQAAGEVNEQLSKWLDKLMTGATKSSL